MIRCSPRKDQVVSSLGSTPSVLFSRFSLYLGPTYGTDVVLLGTVKIFPASGAVMYPLESFLDAACNQAFVLDPQFIAEVLDRVII